MLISDKFICTIFMYIYVLESIFVLILTLTLLQKLYAGLHSLQFGHRLAIHYYTLSIASHQFNTCKRVDRTRPQVLISLTLVRVLTEPCMWYLCIHMRIQTCTPLTLFKNRQRSYIILYRFWQEGHNGSYSSIKEL